MAINYKKKGREVTKSPRKHLQQMVMDPVLLLVISKTIRAASQSFTTITNHSQPLL